ncbi:SDR family NAD(P)-dependent oxidoreductase [Agrobacterium arsenijevicii]|uniref:Short-chain dehydrogenase n=1 Tax=Agrobacterium arsenijevicii TaxID=1585697 RepID=A0ABR5D682_9HYPH|nr:short-chain dehydrogenase [Agrobacterium arsenijevicii]
MSDSMKPVVMISGASRGIGAAAAQAMLDAGWAVSLGMRDTSVSKFSGASVLNCRYDALDPVSEKEWVAETVSRFGGIDGLVLNAGIMMKRTVLEATDEDFDMMFAVNVKSPMRLSQLAWPHLQKKPGRIVVMSSLSGKRVRSAGAGLYGMSKFALTALSQALRQCGKESGIRSTAICPSYVATDMAQGLASAPEEELTRPEDIAILIRTILSLPPSASIAEVPVNWTVEECY